MMRSRNAYETGLAVLILAVAGVGCTASENGQYEVQAAATGVEYAIDPYARTLAAHVDGEGMVDYAGLKADSSDLDLFLQGLANLSRETYDGWSESEQIAFWTNAYNAITLRAIVSHYPIQSSLVRSIAYPKNSIRQIPGVWTKLEWTVMGEPITLDAIEHQRLRKDFDEPRIHAALVCAAMSCPPLRNEPFEGARLDEQLDDQMKRFIGHPDKFRINRPGKTVYLSPIFDWFGEDFVQRFGADTDFGDHGDTERAVLNAITPHIEEQDRSWLKTGDFEIAYLDYDWTLNDHAL